MLVPYRLAIHPWSSAHGIRTRSHRGFPRQGRSTIPVAVPFALQPTIHAGLHLLDGVTEGNRTLTCWDTTNRDYHYTTATMSASGAIRTHTAQALILMPPAIGLQTLELAPPE